ncbi:MAG: FliM/FliN family flagellar motor switch protein [Pseudomonadota bacterium]
MSKESTISNPILEEDHKGIKAILDQALQSYDKLPMLEIVFERLVRSLTSALRNLTSETIEIDIIGFKSLRFGHYLKEIKSPSSIAVFKAIEWENLGIVVLDSHFIFAFVDILLGGKKHLGQPKEEEKDSEEEKNDRDDKERIITYIEQALIKQVVEVILNELGSAFEPISPSTFVFDRLEHNPTFATIARPGDAIILLQLNIAIVGRDGKLDLVIPYNTIEPIKALLQQVFIGDKFGSDAVWTDSLINTIYNIDVPIEAVIHNKPTTIFDVASLKVGHTIVMDHKHDADVTIRCSHVPLFKGQLGKIEEKVAVNINQIIIEE